MYADKLIFKFVRGAVAAIHHLSLKQQNLRHASANSGFGYIFFFQYEFII